MSVCRFWVQSYIFYFIFANFAGKKNMPAYDIRPLQLRILRILDAVDTTCREHGLRYYLWAGTMIGAIRHKGFIPWDDDLDIAMPRPDYERLIAHAEEWLPKPFEMVCGENDPLYPLPFGMVVPR